VRTASAPSFFRPLSGPGRLKRYLMPPLRGGEFPRAQTCSYTNLQPGWTSPWVVGFPLSRGGAEGAGKGGPRDEGLPPRFTPESGSLYDFSLMTEPTAAVSADGAASPLRLLVLADLAPGREDARPLSLDPGVAGVEAALAALAPEVRVTVADRLGAGVRERSFSLRFTTLADFAPAALASAALPDLARARDRLAAGEVVEGLATLAGDSPAASSGGGWGSVGSALDALLSQVDMPAKAPADRSLAELLGGPFDSPAALAAAAAELERRLVRQGVEIADSAPVRDLEAAWRGAERLALAAGGDGSVRLELLPASPGGALEAFFDTVFSAEYEGESAVPLSAVVLGFEVERGAEDVERLRQAARMGESLSVPFLGAVGPGFWGIRQPKLLANLPDLARKVKGPEYGKWNGLRGEEASIWLCLAANRIVLRPAHAESPQGSAGALTGAGSWALGEALIYAFREGGARFPSPSFPGTAEVALSETKALEIAEAGLAPFLRTAGDEEQIHFLALPALHAPKRYDRPQATLAAAAAATLPYQAFTGAAAHVLRRLGRGAEGLSLAEIEERFRAGLRDFLAACGESGETAVTVEIETDPEQPHLAQVAVRLTPAFTLSGAEVDLVLGCAVPH
jgi:type VI secretion system protein ImpC